MSIRTELRKRSAKRAMAMLLAGLMTVGSIGDGCTLAFAEEPAAEAVNAASEDAAGQQTAAAQIPGEPAAEAVNAASEDAAGAEMTVSAPVNSEAAGAETAVSAPVNYEAAEGEKLPVESAAVAQPEAQGSKSEDAANTAQPEAQGSNSEEAADGVQPEAQGSKSEKASETAQSEAQESKSKDAGDIAQPEAQESNSEEAADSVQPEAQESNSEEAAVIAQPEVQESNTEEAADTAQPAAEAGAADTDAAPVVIMPSGNAVVPVGLAEAAAASAPDTEADNEDAASAANAESAPAADTAPVGDNADAVSATEAEAENVQASPAANAAADGEKISELQDMVNKAIATADSLSQSIQILVKKNASYDGDVVLTNGEREVGENFALEIVAEDAGEDGAQGSGTSTVNGNLTIKGIKVILKSIMLGAGKKITVENAAGKPDQGGTLEYIGSNTAGASLTVDVGQNSSASFTMGSEADSLKLTTLAGAKEVTADMGEGANTVTAVVNDGDVTVKTGSGGDTVSVTTQEGADNVNVSTGGGGDAVKVVDNGGKELNINTGGGDDTITADMRAGAVDMTLNTGAGSDTVEAFKGDHPTAETLEYAEYQNTAETINDSATSILVIHDEDEALPDRVTVDADLSDAIRGIRLESAAGTSVHFRGTLKSGIDAPIISADDKDGYKKLTMIGEKEHTLEVWYTDKDNLTDTLDNKKTEYLSATGTSYTYNGTLKDFTNYVFITPLAEVASIKVDSAVPLTLTNLVLDSTRSLTPDDSIGIKDLSAKNINVLVKGRQLNITGNVEAKNFRAELVQGTRQITEDMDFSLDNISGIPETLAHMAADVISVYDAAQITVAEGASVTADQDIILQSRIKHYGGILTLLPAFVNFVNVKVAAAGVDIQGSLNAKKGIVDAKAQIQTTVGVDKAQTETGAYRDVKAGMPVAITVIVNDAAVTVGKSSVITAGSDIFLNSESKIKSLTYADSDTIPSPVDLAFTFISNTVKTDVAGTLTAERNISAKAAGTITDVADSSRSESLTSTIGFFGAINLVLQDVDAVIEESAKLTAKNGKISVNAKAAADVTTSAMAAAGKKGEKSSFPGTIASLKKMASAYFGQLLDEIKQHADSSAILKKIFGSKQEQLEKMLQSVADNDYKVSMISPKEENKKGTASVSTSNSGSKVTAEVRVAPEEGSKVKAVKYRYLVPGEDHYTIGTAEKKEAGVYTFDVASGNTEVYVVYEDGSEPANAGSGDAGAGDPSEDEDWNLGELFDEAASGTDDVQEEEDIYGISESLDKSKECQLNIEKSNDGSTVTWLEHPQFEGKSLDTVYPGQKVLFVPNPRDGQKLSTLTVEYEVKENGKTVKKKDKVEPDKKGRYIFAVPTSAEKGTKFTVKSVYAAGEAPAAEPSGNQVSGAIAFSLVNNDANAVIETGSTIDASGDLSVSAGRTTNDITTADGTNISEDYGKTDEEKEQKQLVNEYKYDVPGAQYAVRMTASQGGKVESTGTYRSDSHPTFKVTPDAGYKVQKAYISYYTKMKAGFSEGSRTTADLKLTDSGEYEADLSWSTVEDGTIVDVNFLFEKEDGTGTDDTASVTEAQYLVKNPIRARYNVLSEKKNDKVEKTSIGTISFKDRQDGKIYFEIAPDKTKGYTAVLKENDTSTAYASYLDTAGVVHKEALKHDAHGWYFDTNATNAPAGALITVVVDFQEDLHDVKQKDGVENGSLSFNKKQVKATDEVTVTAKPADGYYASKVTASWLLDGGSPAPQTRELAVGEDGKVKFTVEPMAENGSLIFTPTFVQKDINLKAEGTADGSSSDKNIKITTGNKAYAGQTVRLSPSDELAQKGYKVSGMEITYYGTDGTQQKIVVEDDSSFVVPDDIRIQGTANMEIKAALTMKPVPLTKSVDEYGEIVPAADYADAGEKVLVNIKPNKDYKIKSGSLKAEITVGTDSQQIVLTRVSGNQYSFVMPGNADAQTFVRFLGEFEPGSDEDSFAAGVSVAVNVALGSANAEVKGGSITARGLSVSADNNGKVSTTANAGFSKGSIGIGGAVSVQVAPTRTTAVIRKDEKGSIVMNGGTFALSSKSRLEYAVQADASGKKGSKAESVGVGAGIAVSVGPARAIGELEEGVKLLTDKSSVSGIDINVAQKMKDTLTAKAGAVGGSSFVPVAAVGVVTAVSSAKLGKITKDMLSVGGAVKVRSTADSSHTITADASSQGGSAAMGGAFAVTWTDNDSQAVLDQSVSAASLLVKSIGSSALKSAAHASAAGGVQSSKNKDKEGGADKQANNLIKAGAKLGGMAGGGLDPNRIYGQAGNRQKAETAENTLGVSASFVLNMQQNSSLAKVKDGVDVTSTGAVTVESTGRTAAEIMANSSTTKTDTGVGVGIAINIVSGDNIAAIGNGTITGKSISVTADIQKAGTPVTRFPTVKDEGSFITTLKKLITDAINKELENENLNFIGDLTGDLVGEVVEEFIKDTGLKKLLDVQSDGGAAGALQTAFELYTAQILKMGDEIADIFVSRYNDICQVADLSAADWENLVKDTAAQIFVQSPAAALDLAKKLLMKDKDKLVAAVLDTVYGSFGGPGPDWSALTDAFKQAGEEFVTELAKKFWTDLVTRMSGSVPGLRESDIQYLMKLASGDESGWGIPVSVLKDFFDKTTGIFRDKVFDYEKYLVPYLESGKLGDMIMDKILSAVKQGTVAVTNEALDKLTDALGVRLPKEPTADRHVITTQAVSGAGAKEKSGAGSLAVAVINLNTRAEIAGGSGALTTSDPEEKLNVTANEIRRVRTVASAAVDARGDADANAAAGKTESKDSGAANSGESTLSYNNMTITTSLGGTAEFDPTRAEDDPRVWLNIETGFKVPENLKAKRHYKEESGEESSVKNEETGEEMDELLTIHSDGSGRYYVLPYEGKDKDEAKERPIFIEIQLEENLHKIAVPKVTGTGIQEGAVEVSVKGRKVEDDTLKARAGEFVQVTTKKIKGKKVSGISYKYVDDKGVAQEVKAEEGVNVIGSSNKDETVYLIKMPDGEITDIEVFYVDGEDETGTRDGAGRKVGVGAAVAFTYGDSSVKASVGKRGDEKTGIKAGTINVKAASDHNEYNFSVAGSDPFEGTSNDAKDIGIDVSLALNLLNNDISASIAEKTRVETTGTVPADYDKLKGKIQEETEEGKEEENEEKDATNRYLPTVISGGLYVVAHETTHTDSRASSFATGSDSAVGASAAVNISTSDINAIMGSGADVKGEAYVSADSTAKDNTWSIATAFGSDIQKALNKFADASAKAESAANKLTTGEVFDKYTSEKRNKKTQTGARINKGLNDKKKDGADNAEDGLPTSTNVLRSQGVNIGDDGGAGNAQTEAEAAANKASGRTDIKGQDDQNQKQKWQAAATVGFTWADHNAAAFIGGAITAGKDLTATAINHGNFNTRSTAAAMSFEEKKGGGSTIAGAGAVSVNNNKATVDTRGNMTAKDGDLQVVSDLTLNMDDDYRGKLGAQALSGAGSGKSTDVTLSGAVAVIVSQSETRARTGGVLDKEAFSLTGDNISVTATDKTKLALRAGGMSISRGSNIGVGISAATIVSNNKVNAEIADNATITGSNLTLAAQKKGVDFSDYVFPLTWKDLITSSDADIESNSGVDTGIFHVTKKPGEASYKVEVNADTYRLMKVFDMLNFLSSTNYYTEAIAGSLSGGSEKSNQFNGAGSFAVVNAANTILTSLGENAKVVLTKKNEGTADAVVRSESTSNARMIGGALSGSKSNAAAGITVTYFGDTDDVKTQIKKGAQIGASGSITVGTSADTTAENYNAAAALNTSKDAALTLGGAVNVILLKNKARDEIGENVKLLAADKLGIDAAADMNLSLVSGSVSGSSGGVAAGGTVAYIGSNTEAVVEIGNNHVLQGTNGVDVKAAASDRILSVLASLSAAIGSSGNGAFAGAINVLVSGTKSNVTLGSGGKDQGIFSGNGSVNVSGDGQTQAVNVTVAGAGSKGAAIGMSVNVNVFDRETKVNVAGGADYAISAKKDVSVQANGSDLTVLAGLALAGSTQSASLTGNVQVAVASNAVEAKITSANITAGGEAAFASAMKDRTYAIAGSIAFGKQAAVGATALVVVKGNTVTTELGSSIVKASGAAGTLAAGTFGKPSFKGVYVGAVQSDVSVMGAAGIAISGEAGVSVNINQFVNKSTIQAHAQNAEITADAGGIRLEAKDDTEEWMIAGGVAAGKTAGVGAAVAGIYSYKTVEAFGGKMTAQTDVSAAADNKDAINMLALSVGGGNTVAVQVGVAVQILSSKAKARLYKDVEAKTGSVSVAANNQTDLINVAGAVAASGQASISPVAVVTYFTGETESSALAKVTAAKDIKINASADKNIDQYTLGVSFAGSGLGLSGGATVLYSKDSVLASAGAASALTSTGGNISIDASGDFISRAVAGVVAGSGGAAVAVNAVVGIIKSKVVAELANTASAKDVSVTASASRDVVDAALSAGFAGEAAVGATVMTLFVGQEKLSQDAYDALTYGNATDRNDDSKVFDAKTLMSNASDYGLDTGDVDLDAELQGDGVRDSEISATDPGDSDDEDGAKNSINDPTQARKANASETPKVSGKDEGPADMVMARITDTADVTVTGDVNVKALQPTTADLYGAILGISGGGSLGASVTYAELHSNVLAIAMGSIHSSGGKVNVNASSTATSVDVTKDADEQKRMDSIKNNVGDNAFAKLDPTRRSIRAISAAVCGGMAGIGAAVSVVRTDNVTDASLGGKISEAGEINVHADSAYDNVLSATLSIGAGEVGAGASVSVAASDAEVSARIDGSAVIRNEKNGMGINVTTDTLMNVDSMAACVAGGAAAIVGGMAYANNNLKQNTSIDKGAYITGSIEKDKAINVKATSTTNADTVLLKADGGAAAINLGATVAIVKPTVNTTIGIHGNSENASYIVVDGAPVNVTNVITSKASPWTFSAAVGAGEVGVSVLETLNESDVTARITNATLFVDSINVSSALKADGHADLIQADVGGLAIGVSSNHVDLNARNTAAIDLTNCNIETTKGVRIDTGDENTSLTDAGTKATTFIVGLVALGRNVAKTQNRTVNIASLSGNGSLRTGSGSRIEVEAYGKAKATADMLGIAVAGVNAQAGALSPVSEAVNKAVNKAVVDLKSALISDLSVKSTLEGETTATMETGSLSLLEVTSSRADAKGQTASLIDVNLAKTGNMNAVSLDVQNTGKDTVKSSVDHMGINLITVMLLDSMAESTDVYRTTVNLGQADKKATKFKLKDLKIKTDYDSIVDASLEPASGGFQVNALDVSVNHSNAVNKSYAGSVLNVNNTDVQVDNGIDVTVSGNAAADSLGKSAKVTVSAGSFGPTEALADMSSVQAAAINLNKGKLTSTGGSLNLTSEIRSAHASSRVGSMGKDPDDDSDGADITLLNAKPFTATAKERIQSTASIKGTDSAYDSVKAGEIHVRSGAAEGVTTKANAESKANIGISLATFGALKADASSSEQIYAATQNAAVTAASGIVEFAANGNAESEANSTSPGNWTAVGAQGMEIESRVGIESGSQTVQTLIGDGTVINGKSVRIQAVNAGNNHGEIKKQNDLVLLEVADSKSTIESFYNTGVYVGKEAQISSDGGIDIVSQTKPVSKSVVNTKSSCTGVDVADMHGDSRIKETNNLSIGELAALKAQKNLNLTVKSSADSLSDSYFDGGYAILGESKSVYANNSVDRTLLLTVGRDATLQSAGGGIDLLSISGEEDKIKTTTYIDGDGTFYVGDNAYAISDLRSENTVRIWHGVTISAEGDINIRSIATSKNGTGNGVYSRAAAHGGSLIPNPYANAKINLDLVTNVNINKGKFDGRTSITSNSGNISLYAGNDGMKLEASSDGDGKGVAGNATGRATVGGMIGYSDSQGVVKNTVWVDNADLKAKQKVTFRSGNGSASVTADALSEMYSAYGEAYSDAWLEGEWSNEVATYKKDNVSVVAAGFVHEALSPQKSVDYHVKADTNTKGIIEISHPNRHIDWKYFSQCDWCTEPKEERTPKDETTAYTSKEEELKAAFTKALDAINEIQKMADSVEKDTGITKARYGEEDEKTAGEIFVLSLMSILGKDVRLDLPDIRHYLLWNNSDTKNDIYLLPNAARLTMGPNTRLLYVTDVIRGDALGDGKEHTVDVITALTKKAFENAVINVGSDGSLSVQEGILRIPAHSDLELYLDEISGSWLLEKMDEQFIQVLFADQDEINSCALTGTELPSGEMKEGLTAENWLSAVKIPQNLEKHVLEMIQADSLEDLEFFWVGSTPETAEDADEPLYLLAVNTKTDEADAYRTSVNMLNNDEGIADLSLYLYRDSKSDRKGIEKYNLMFFDTPETEDRSLVKAITDVLMFRDLEMPLTLKIEMRKLSLDGADLPCYSISGHLFAMNDGTDGTVSMFDGFYKATFDGDVFESDYTRVEGIADGDPVFTIKADQPVWPEWETKTTAKDIAGNSFNLENNEWTKAEAGEEPAAA